MSDRGGDFGRAYLRLGVRHVLGSLLGAGSLLWVARVIGPREFGLFAAALGIIDYFLRLSEVGLAPLLLGTKEGEEDVWSQAFSFSVTAGAVLGVVASLAVVLVSWWIGDSDVRDSGIALALSLPIVAGTIAPRSWLERRFAFDRLVRIELCVQALYLLVAGILAWRGWGRWAPITGWWVQSVVTLVWCLWASERRFVLRPPTREGLTLLVRGMKLGLATLPWQMRSLVPPLIVGPSAGVEAIGLIGLTQRVVERLAFVRAINWRLSLATAARLKASPRELAGAIESNALVQTLLLGSILAAFSLLPSSIYVAVLGEAWAGVVSVYPYLAMAALVATAFAMHAAALSVMECRRDLATFNLLNLAVLCVGTATLTPAWGAVGFGIADALAALGHFFLQLRLGPRLGGIRWAAVAVWLAAFCAAIHWRQVGLAGWFAPALLALTPVGIPLVLARLRQLRALSTAPR